MPYKDPEKRKEAFKKYYEQNKEKVLVKNRQWYADNVDRAREINKHSHKKLYNTEKRINHGTMEEALESLLPKIEPPKPPEPPKPETPEPPKPETLSEQLAVDPKTAEIIEGLKQITEEG